MTVPVVLFQTNASGRSLLSFGTRLVADELTMTIEPSADAPSTVL